MFNPNGESGASMNIEVRPVRIGLNARILASVHTERDTWT
jgi:hypothetical protein